MTYLELKQAIARFLHRSDLTNDMDTLVELAAGDIRESLRSMSNQSATQITETERVSGGVYALPDDFLEVSGLSGVSAGSVYELTPVGRAELSRFSGVGGGAAFVYSINDGQIEFAPTPATDTFFDLIYFTVPGALVNDTDTNDILVNQPGVYLYLSLAHGHTLAQDHQQSDVCRAKGEMLIARMNAQADRARYGAAPITTGDYNFNSSSSWGSF